MRTTIELPDELYRTLKVRAALSGVPLRVLVQGLIERGLRGESHPVRAEPGRRPPPPVVVPPTGTPVPALTRAELRRLEEDEDEERHARPSGR
ncbi:MAG TPA: hypothetical protein VNO86_05320 [Candidatus Binatia bacterium]|nr:hypothetical protein [Candidatus Binatia bacterium]